MCRTQRFQLYYANHLSVVQEDPNHELGMAPSAYAQSAKEHGFDIISWSLERAGPGLQGWYWQTLEDTVAAMDPAEVEGYRYALLHVLAQDVGVMAVFSDWPATTSFYANCMGIGTSRSGSKTGKVPKVFKEDDHIMAKATKLFKGGKTEKEGEVVPFAGKTGKTAKGSNWN